MLPFHQQKTSADVDTESSLLLSLLIRIHRQRTDDTQYKRLRNVRNIFSYLHICFFGLILFQCHKRIYNAWMGPFHINLDQFATELKTYTEFRYNTRPFFSRWFSFDYEYLQIELDEDMIDQDMTKTFRVFNGQHSYEKLLYTFNHVRESVIDHNYNKLYIKMPSNKQSYFHRRLSYNFQAFNIHTLRCIVRQLDISPMQYLQWNEKTTYIQAIEQIYNQNPTLFNIKVILKCGIYLLNRIHPPTFTIHHSVQNELEKANINSISILDNLLLNTIVENKHFDRLFLIQDKYLIILMINFNEKNPEILRQFDKRSPFEVISLDTIESVHHYHIVVANDSRSKYIYFPNDSYLRDSNTSEWLHQRLMHINDLYRHRLEQKQILQQQEILHAQQEEYQRHLKALIEEEAEYQYRTYGYDFNRMWHRIVSASPRFIAQFRLEDHQLVNINQPNIECSLCYEEFRTGQHFAQWPCEAKHTFHFDCMLSALRARNTCPLCRHPVEAAHLPSRETILQYMTGRVIPRFFT
ncbi:unnamed protein product [Rotaria sp. Silwood1]|nr:unnamed protein product [Rotaria sp. Silwood1]CAF1643765.1 unnamed protein product [Rotaria sp. Silwood1]